LRSFKVMIKNNQTKVPLGGRLVNFDAKRRLGLQDLRLRPAGARVGWLLADATHRKSKFNRHDADTLASMLTEDTVFENTSPAPDGQRIEGKTAVAAFWREWFERNPDARFEAEEMIVSGDRAVVRWVYRKMRNGQPWHVRGVDVFTVRDGKVAAKLAYVKG